jgi:hypothetical protein
MSNQLIRIQPPPGNGQSPADQQGVDLPLRGGGSRPVAEDFVKSADQVIAGDFVSE